MTKFVPKIDHAEVQSCVIRLYGNFYPTWRALSELNVTCGQDRVVPDVTVVGLDAKYDDGDLVSNPVFAVEIMSPGQTLGNIFDRSDRLVKCGTPLVIVIWPERRRVWAYAQEDAVETTGVITTGVPALDFDVAAMWAALGPNEELYAVAGDYVRKGANNCA